MRLVKGCCSSQSWISWLILLVAFFPAYHSAEISCPQADSRVLTIQQSCTWVTPPAASWGSTAGPHGESLVVQGALARGDSGQILPVVITSPGSQQEPSDWSLLLERLVLQNVDLPVPTGSAAAADQPARLWPLNMYPAFGASLTMRDVRLVTSEVSFQQHLIFFQKELGAAWPMYTDNSTFVHVSSWTDSRTTLRDVTLTAGACSAPQLWSAAGVPAKRSSASNSSTSSGSAAACGVFIADNTTLVPLLTAQGGVASRRMLLVLLQDNTTLINRVTLRRPVAMVGLASVVTSIDFQMVVNQIDLVSPTAALLFNGVVLENNAPGDVTSALTAAPYSVLTPTCVWSIYCPRDNPAKPCIQLQNVTLVIAESNLDYITYMFSMFNSPLPGVQRLTEFYAKDLNFTQLTFVAGPGHDAITVTNGSSLSWKAVDVIISSRHVVAPVLQPPMRPFAAGDSSTAAALVANVYDCESLKEALLQKTIASRLHIFVMTASINLAPTTQGRAQAAPSAASASGRKGLQAARLGAAEQHANSTIALAPAVPWPTCLGSQAVFEYTSQVRGQLPGQVLGVAPEWDPRTNRLPAMPALAFGYTRNAIFLPSQKSGQLTFTDVMLRQLPQGGSPAELAAATAAGKLPAEAWTVLLWAVNSTLTARALLMRNCVFALPEPEYRMLSSMARMQQAFIIELHNQPDALTFKDAWDHVTHMHVTWLEGPGVLGENITLVPDEAAAKDMPGGYFFDDDDAEQAWNATPHSQQPPQLQGVVLAVVVPLVVLLLGAAGLAVCWWQRNRRQGANAAAAIAASHMIKTQCIEPSPFAGLDATCERGSNENEKPSSPGRQHHQQPLEQPQLPKALTSSCRTSPAAPSSSSNRSVVHIDINPLLPCAAGGADAADSSASNQISSAAAAGQRQPGSKGVRSSRDDSRRPASLKLPADAACCTDQQDSSQQQQRRQPQPGRRVAFAVTEAPHRPRSPLDEADALHASLAGSAGGSHENRFSPDTAVVDSVTSGLQRWKAAVSSTTMSLVARRLAVQDSVNPGSSSSSCNTSEPGDMGQRSSDNRTAAACAGGASSLQKQGHSCSRMVTGATAATPAAAGRTSSAVAVHGIGGLQLKRPLGKGSFGSVYLAVWRGITVAVKMMHLPSSFLDKQDARQDFGDCSELPQQNAVAGSSGRRAPGGEQEQQGDSSTGAGCLQHFAILEAVLSSILSHPNIVQVYTYMLTPLFDETTIGSINSSSASNDGNRHGPERHTIVCEQGSTAADVATAARAAAGGAAVAGWSLKLVMEYCSEGTLRDAIDKGLLVRPGACFISLGILQLLLRDVAAAMLHLHSEGVVHGDLKTANVMLTSRQAEPGSLWMDTLGCSLTAKVADFGLAVPLGPADTHASLTPRGTPSHISPELFLSGHVSKASDVYSFGILLYELVSSRRAFAGVPVALLPHEVAVEGARPIWPAGMGLGYKRLQAMAEACWDQDPQQRPTFHEIFDALQSWAEGKLSYRPPWEARQLQQQRHSLAKLVVSFQGMQQQQQLRHEQWLQHRQQAEQERKPQPARPETSKPAATEQGAAGAAGGAGRLSMAWSEVSFEAMGTTEAETVGAEADASDQQHTAGQA